MRAAVVGTGWWAEHAHGAGLAAADDVDLVGVWGRDPEKAGRLADALGVRAFASYDELLDEVELVSFSVPPHVQAELATVAARRGRHVLLEKPVALSVNAARSLERAVQEAGVASVVFFTACFTPERRQWVADLAAGGPWRGASAVWLASAFAPGSPFDTPWRHEHGALWDIGPHLVAAMTDALGPVSRVLSAARGRGDLVHLVLEHEGGATSTATLTLQAPPAVSRSSLSVWGDGAVLDLPRSTRPPAEALATAASELVASARTGSPHPVDASFGRRVVEVLAEAERLAARGSG